MILQIGKTERIFINNLNDFFLQDRQLGLPIKDLSSDALQCIFKCKAGHGRLIPVHEIILYNKGTTANCSLVNSNYSDRVQGEASKTSNGINKRIPVCTHQ